MKEKTMALGEIKRNKRKTLRRAGWTDYSTGNRLRPHRGVIKFSVFRTYGQRGGDYPRSGGDYTATACLGRKRCARAEGPTPTKAVRRALALLTKKIK
jgi:hypothetical protein